MTDALLQEAGRREVLSIAGRAGGCRELDYAFNLLNLNNVMLGVFSFNERALALYRGAGFREIGQRRQDRTRPPRRRGEFGRRR